MDHRRTIIRTSARVCIQTRAYGCAYKLRHSAMQVLWNNNTTPIRNGQILGKIYNVYSLLSPVSYRADLDCLQNKDLTDDYDRTCCVLCTVQKTAGWACVQDNRERKQSRHHQTSSTSSSRSGTCVCMCVRAHTHPAFGVVLLLLRY